MKYACLVYLEEGSLRAVSDGECMNYGEGLRSSGHWLGGQALEPTRDSTSVRVRNGKVTITDGPFAETKEQLAGFYLIEARDLNDAIRLAAAIPPARVGTVEIRPVRELSAD